MELYTVYAKKRGGLPHPDYDPCRSDKRLLWEMKWGSLPYVDFLCSASRRQGIPSAPMGSGLGQSYHVPRTLKRGGVALGPAGCGSASRQSWRARVVGGVGGLGS
eukprot:744333-Amphidinium_carterae.1